MKSKCLNCFTQGVYTPKNSCFDAWLCKHQFSRSFYNTSLGTILNSKSCVWFGLLATSNRINFHGHFDYFSFSFQILHYQNLLGMGKYRHQIYHQNATMYTRWAWNISEWVRTTNHSWCSYVLSLYDSFELKSGSISGLPSSF